MAIDPAALLGRNFPPIEQSYGIHETILYALGVGLGGDPLDERELRFVYEKDLLALPSMVQVLGHPGFWAKQPDTGINWQRLVHAGQSFTLHGAIPPIGKIVAQNRVSALYDRGPDRGAVLVQNRQVRDAISGALIATIEQTSLLRGDGGFGGEPDPTGPPTPLLDREPDMVCDLATPAQLALLYRLNGDFNPLHADPQVAHGAGFERPILHGMCTMGIACHAIIRSALDYDATRLRSMAVRFSAPFMPGETLRTEIWRDGGGLRFRSLSRERGIVVLGNGDVRLH
jgi:acyl dehydratase